MQLLMGEYEHSLDAKNRVIIPAKFREVLGPRFVVTRGIEKCLYAYSEADFQQIVNKLETLPFTKKDARLFTRFFLSGATTVELDKQGRITLTSPLVSYASLEHDLTIIGTGDRIEIWPTRSFKELMDSTYDSMSDVADTLFSNLGE